MAENFEPRRATKGARLQTTAADGRQFVLRADARGIVRPSNAEQVALADVLDLPVARTETETTPRKRSQRSAKRTAGTGKPAAKPTTTAQPAFEPAPVAPAASGQGGLTHAR